jgi:hypothetical protein
MAALQPSDYGQGVRYIEHGMRLLERESFSVSIAMRDPFDRIILMGHNGTWYFTVWHCLPILRINAYVSTLETVKFAGD